MSLENVKNHFKQWGRDKDIMEFDTSSGTVQQAADTIGVIPARIAKTLSFRGKDDKAILVVTAGDTKIDNKKFRNTFHHKARMLSADEVVAQTGHVIGGVCPFGLANELEVYLDVSMKRFDTVFPACGSTNSAIELSLDELFEYATVKEWVDTCKGWEKEQLQEAVATGKDDRST
ncbi:prolyl-tRNA editing enzyme YbaK/EbsC (Cys-tRNA(Pro) deacylase) [Virgibacillus halotolerans]|uniref:YbaK/EbsC family protein n=1 Tax=Virgibacillus halotolerans TaxID=1071053 RepID=UPI001960CDB0|nr:YbaK/EbsC family protein [Virgibacillus halotolerans]MBM7599353.1 prolyl-tRNA editing enzyme YbaK/EbsC (Cys-tRNA(Pro) deacylase) [Virgibacillus halotolerans]